MNNYLLTPGLVDASVGMVLHTSTRWAVRALAARNLSYWLAAQTNAR